MKKRMIIMLVAVFAFIAAVGGFKYLQIKKAMAGANYTPPPEAVTTMIAEAQTWDSSLRAIGSVAAVQGVTVSADLPGVVEQISFESGQQVDRGDVLVRLDTKQEQAQLQGALANLELSRVDLKRKQGLSSSEVIPQAMLDQSVAENRQAEARVAEIRATIQRKTIRAPFSGVLGIRQVNLGQYVSPGTPIVELQSIRPVFVNFTVPQQQAGLVHPGALVSVTSDGMSAIEAGKVAALDSIVNESTRAIRVQALFDNRSGALRPGMFVEAELADGASSQVIPLPVSAISYAPYGDSVFIVDEVAGLDGTKYQGVRQQFVKLGTTRGDLVAVLSGVQPGEQVVTSGAFKLRPGAAVVIQNDNQPSASPNPQPEES